MFSKLIFLKVLSLFVFLLLFVSYFFGRYTILPDKQIGVHSTPYKLFLVDTWTKEYSLNDLVVFKAERTEPVILEGQNVVKFVRGVSGDVVSIVAGGVRVNDTQHNSIPLQQAKYFKKELSDFDDEYLVPEEAFFAMGTHLRSYDSRYWGPVFNDQIVGLAYPIF